MNLITQPIRQRRQLYRLLSLGIKEVHYQDCHLRCPPQLHRITSISILPRVFDTDCTVRTLSCQQLAEEWELSSSNSLEEILRELTFAKHAEETHLSWTSFLLTCHRILEFRLNTEPNFPRSVNRIYTWNLTSWTPQHPSNTNKNYFIRKALKKGPVMLQETKWTQEQYRHILHTWPDIPIAHSPANQTENGLSGGIAILLPSNWSIQESKEIEPSFAIAVKAKQAGYLVWFVSIYIRLPLDRQWIKKTLTSTAQIIRGLPAFVGIDCNRIDKAFPDMWTDFLTTADLTDISPDLNTFFYQGGSSPLDRILVPSLMVDAAHLHASAFCMHFYDKFGHQPVQGKIQCPPKLAIHPNSIKHETIPTTAFCAPVTSHNAEEAKTYQTSIGKLLRALFDHIDPTNLSSTSVKAKIWTWWRKAKSERSLPNKIVGLYKYLFGQNAHAVVKSELLQELCQTIDHPAFTSTDHFPKIGNCSVIPKTLLIEGLNLAKELLNHYHNVQITAPIPNPVLQAISQKNLWEKLKVLCPRGQYYSGPIYDNQGRKCTTAADYDNAMLATREFWFTPPISGTTAWIDTLSTYQQHSQPWPTLPTPQLNDYYTQILHTKDSSPGPDGIPYAAWRVSPTVTSHILTKEFMCLVRGISPPPQQVGVWIPKAKMGPTADYFRPLGMPDTLDRLMDGTTAGILFTHTRHCFHPSQTMLNHFREPQSATLAVQAALDSTSPRAALFLDLAKAFECVNAHWILRLLFIKQAPSWVIQLAQRVFFGRSIRHKVQGRLLPPRTVHSGVDMGRSSSVFFFCLAMDPIFVYLNRIPQCVLVAGYVDDTTIVGEAHSDFNWISQILQACSSWASAGFRIDMHGCWHIGYCSSYLENQNRLLTVDTAPTEIRWVTTSGCSCFTHLSHFITRPLMQVIIKREQYYTVVSWCTFVAMHTYGHKLLHQLASPPCKCRSKLAVLTNQKLTCRMSVKLDNTTLGMQTLTDQTLSLGLQISGYYKYEASGKCEKQAALATLALVAPKATQKSQLRLGIIVHSRRSIHSRINYFNAYMLSCYYYAESACQILPKDLSPQYRQLSQACLGRSWLQAKHLAFILRFLRIGPALDPSIMQGVAVFGYFLRAGHTLSEIHYPNTTYTKQIAAFWTIWQLRLTRKDVNTLLCIQGATPKQTADRFTTCFKKLALTAQLPCSLNYLSTRCLSNGWPGSPSYRFLTQLAQIPEQHFAPVPRYTILRWAIGEDNDYWFQFRGTDISRKNPCCGCGATGKSYPISPKAGCFCNNCFPPTREVSTYYVTWQDREAFEQLYHTTLPEDHQGMHEATQVAEQIYNPEHQEVTPCVLCGRGHNGIDHWLKFCPIPSMTFNSLLKQKSWIAINFQSIVSKEHAIIQCWVIFHLRRYLRELGAFDPAQKLSPSRNILDIIRDLGHRIYPSLPTKFADLLQTPKDMSLTKCLTPAAITAIRLPAVQLESALTPAKALVNTVQTAANSTVAVISPKDSRLSLLRLNTNHALPNNGAVTINTIICDECQQLHVRLDSVQELKQNTVLSLALPSGCPVLLIQFDGSCHAHAEAGGAGVAALQITAEDTFLAHWQSTAIPNCKDNIVAEAYACKEALSLAVRIHTDHPNVFRKIIVQGDILPLINYMNYKGRLRRIEIAQIMEECQAMASQLANCIQFEYLPRECNGLADYFAGFASAFLLSQPLDHITNLSPPLPYSLLHMHGFKVDHTEVDIALTLTEQPQFSLTALTQYLHKYPRHTQAWRQYRDRFSQAHLTVHYRPTSAAPLGRLYAIESAAQTLPKPLRILLFGTTHAEVDITGAHYEIVRRFSHTADLLPIIALRQWLHQQLDLLIVNNQQDVLIKRWPLVIINSTDVDSAIRYLQLQLTAPMPHSVWSFAIVLHKIGKAFTKRMLEEYEQGLESKPQSACFRVCEVLERKLTEAFLQQLQRLHAFSSIIWLHDGIWVAPPPAPTTIEATNDHVCRTFNIDTMPPLFRLTKLQPSTPGEDQILPTAKFDSRPHPLGGTAIKKRALVADAASAQMFDKQQERLQKRRKQFP